MDAHTRDRTGQEGTGRDAMVRDGAGWILYYACVLVRWFGFSFVFDWLVGWLVVQVLKQGSWDPFKVRQDEIRRDEDEWMKGIINGRNGRD